MRFVAFLVYILLSHFIGLRAQRCSALGQNPETAFPVCGTQTFTQTSVAQCGNRGLPGPCAREDIEDKNPYWYKFTCYQSGTLGFLITPKVGSDDYDWQLFDITGKKSEDVYKDASMFVASNWSGESGKTGASAAGASVTVCTGMGKPLFSAMPRIQEGHEYLLLISHFTETQSGYTLDFNGGTASITDTKVAAFVSASAICRGDEIQVQLNKKMLCSSLAADGSDFTIDPAIANIVSASSSSCTNGFDMDAVVLKLSQPLTPGMYTIALKAGTDRNTLLDRCKVAMAPANITVEVFQNVSAAFTYQVNAGCLKDTVLLFHDGANNTSAWLWQFENGSIAQTQHAQKFFDHSGTTTVRLKVANEHCSDVATVAIQLSEKLHAAFDAPEIMCVSDKAVFTDKSTGPISNWDWDLGNGSRSIQSSPLPFHYQKFSPEKIYTVSLTISSAVGCTRKTSRNVQVVSNCSINVPSGFTPNNDGRNDQLYPSNAFNTENLLFRVYNRFGQLVYESRDWTKKWDGTLKGQMQPTGTYVWTLNYKHKSTGKIYSLKGTTVLIR